MCPRRPLPLHANEVSCTEQAEDALGLRHLRLEGAGTAQALDSVTQILLTAACCEEHARDIRHPLLPHQQRDSPWCARRQGVVHLPPGAASSAQKSIVSTTGFEPQAFWRRKSSRGALFRALPPRKRRNAACRGMYSSRAPRISSRRGPEEAKPPRPESTERARSGPAGPPPGPPPPSQVQRLPQEGPGLLVRRPLRPQVPNGPRWNSPALSTAIRVLSSSIDK